MIKNGENNLEFDNSDYIDQHKLLKRYVDNNQDSKIIELTSKYPYDPIFQSCLLKLYIKQEKLDEAKIIIERFPQNSVIQNQLIKFYIGKNMFDEAIEICKKFPNNPTVQLNAIKIYLIKEEYSDALAIINKFPENDQIQIKLKDIPKSYRNYQNGENYIIANKIRAKLYLNTINSNDINYLEENKILFDENTYNLILASIYERFGNITKAIAVLKTIKKIDAKKINKLIEEMKTKKPYYRLEKWDQIIKEYDYINTSFIEQEKLEEKRKQEKIIKEEIKNKPTIKKEKKISKSNNRTLFRGTTNNSTKISDNKEKRIKKDKNTITIYESLHRKYKEIIYDIKLKYYVEMNKASIKQNYEDLKKYTKLYDLLEDSLNSSITNDNAFEKFMLVLIHEGYKEEIEKDFEKKYINFYEKIEEKTKVLTKKG